MLKFVSKYVQLKWLKFTRNSRGEKFQRPIELRDWGKGERALNHSQIKLVHNLGQNCNILDELVPVQNHRVGTNM